MKTNDIPLISVIIPVYNNAKYIKACLDSVLAQTYRQFEIIAINDGSTDRSGDILRQYAEKNDCIKVIHQENGGVSAARNAGLDAASGEYITFLDSDDTQPPDALESYYSLVRGDIDLIIGSFTEKWLYDKEYLNEDREFTKKQIAESFPRFNRYIAKIACLFYRKSIIDSAGLRFQTEIRYGEDYNFNLMYTKSMSGSAVLTSKNVYNYYTYRSSANRTYQPEINQYYLSLLDSVSAYFDGKENVPYNIKVHFAELYVEALVQHHAYFASKKTAEKKIKELFAIINDYYGEEIVKSAFTPAQYSSLQNIRINEFMKEYFGINYYVKRVRVKIKNILLDIKNKLQ